MRFSVRAALLLLITLAVYAPTLRHGFVYEDGRDAHLTLDPARYGLSELMQMPYRSTAKLSKALDIALFGIQPWGFHLGSMLWHGLNVVLLFAVAWLILPPWGAVLAAGVFALHPIQVEAVAYVSARPDLVTTTGVLLALLSASLGSFTGAVCGVLFACLSKETSIVAWGLVPLWAAWTSAAFPVKRWIWCVAGCGAVGLFFLRFYFGALTVSPTLAGAQLAAIWRLLALVPVPYGFTVDHDWAAVAGLGPLALVGSLGLTAWAVTEGWTRRSWLAFAWLWTLLALAPRLFVSLQEGLHEHHMMIPLIGWCLCAGHWLADTRALRKAVS